MGTLPLKVITVSYLHRTVMVQTLGEDIIYRSGTAHRMTSQYRPAPCGARASSQLNSCGIRFLLLGIPYRRLGEVNSALHFYCRLHQSPNSPSTARQAVTAKVRKSCGCFHTMCTVRWVKCVDECALHQPLPALENMLDERSVCCTALVHELPVFLEPLIACLCLISGWLLE